MYSISVSDIIPVSHKSLEIVTDICLHNKGTRATKANLSEIRLQYLESVKTSKIL